MQSHNLLPTSINSDNSVNFTNHKEKIAPSGREINFKLNYSYNVSGLGVLDTLLSYSNNPNHSELYDDEVSAFARFKMEF